MGIMSFIKSQVIDIIEWLDDTNYTLVYRFPDDDHEVKNGAKLICREGQACVLVNEGQVADVFGPGTHTLSTQNVPVLSRLRGWKYGFASPFKVEVYFINLRQFVEQKWGTSNPVLVRDPEFGVQGRPGRVRIRAFGSYNFRVIDPGLFFKEIVGTNGLVTTDDIEGFVKRKLVSSFSEAAGKSNLSVMDMAANYSVLADAVKAPVSAEVEKLGIALTDFTIQNISLPPEVEAAIDQAASQAARGVDNTLAWEGMQAMRDAARQPGAGSGVMQAGLGMGMGMGMGNMMGNMMGQAMPGMMPGYPPGYPPPGYPMPGHPGAHPGYPPGYAPQGAAAGAMAGAAAGAAAAPAADTLESKLLKLKGALDAGLLTEDEYKAKRAQLLADF
jgi:membrane protease subunit (stomatin/prohibitin family)